MESTNIILDKDEYKTLIDCQCKYDILIDVIINSARASYSKDEVVFDISDCLIRALLRLSEPVEFSKLECRILKDIDEGENHE